VTTIKNSLISNNKALLSCLLIGVAIPITAQADTVDDVISNFTAKASAYNDSTGIRIEDRFIQYERLQKNKKHKPDLKLEAHDYDVDGETGKDSYHGSDVVGTITKEFNKYVTGEFSVGTVYLENQRTRDYTQFAKYKGKATIKPNSKVTITAEHGEDLLFKEAIIEDDANKLVSGETSRIATTWRAAERIIVEGSSQYRKLSDDNSSEHHRGALLYGISTGTPWVWAGVEAQSLSYDDKKTNYWSPEEYQAYALIANGNFTVTKKLKINANASVNRTKEDNFAWATGGAISVGTDYALTEKTSVKTHATYLQSTRDTTQWNGNSVGASFTVSHF
jgi:hypothetical protein